MLESKELKAQLEAEFQEKLKKMEKELENSIVKAAGKHCCKTRTHLFTFCKARTVNKPKYSLLYIPLHSQADKDAIT